MASVPRPMFVDYKDIELFKKLVNRHGKIVSRQRAAARPSASTPSRLAIKRARLHGAIALRWRVSRVDDHRVRHHAPR